jgi:hypothetical protein
LSVRRILSCWYRPQTNDIQNKYTQWLGSLLLLQDPYIVIVCI